ncbi:hypothetical protein WICPIJ_007084 [Wickerhamomyces pijperi]|uniref:Rab-GAP TBC domain-containing protein n=1 Tax=Wickerhamomyces pijperi TaxID=599730 RepID=A0A9P8TK99_WICPI|nr:hypothetical protein WICPIJ_007084 [Wickerhamomyces pijperi]
MSSADPSTYPGGQINFLYVKSKVYIHPSTRKQDNLPGFLYVFKPHPTATNNELTLGWVAECNVDKSSELYRTLLHVDSTGNEKLARRPAAYGSFSFALRFMELYSIQLRTPHPGWWAGSIVLNSKSGYDNLPVLFFHDDESESTKKEMNARKKNFEIFGEDKELFWGGSMFLSVLKKWATLVRTTVDKSVYLVNPTQDDVNNFSPHRKNGLSAAEDENADKNKGKSGSNLFSEGVNKWFTETKWTVLDKFAQLTKLTQDKLTELNNTLSQDPYYNKLISHPEVQKQLNSEYGDMAKEYLAHWAMKIREQSNRSRRIEMSDKYRDLLVEELGINRGNKLISETEILNAYEGSREVTEQEWERWFDSEGRLCITVGEVEERIFHGGVCKEIRGEVWLFLLGVYDWSTSAEDRTIIAQTLESDYKLLKTQWQENQTAQDDEYFKDQVFRIEKDIKRTDRNMELYKRTTPDEDEELAITNPHLLKLKDILLTFNQFNDKLGYVQGMTDLLSPLYYLYQDETVTFWAFAKLMDRMERNFLHDQSGILDQITTLNDLVQFMLPALYGHLESCDSNNFVFFFRMLLVLFKRELPWGTFQKLWDILFTNWCGSQFHLFVILAILQKNEWVLINTLNEFDQFLKFFNELTSGYSEEDVDEQGNPISPEEKFDLVDLLTRAELLFLKFKSMINVIDLNTKPGELSPISDNLRQLLSKEIVIKRETKRVIG